MGLFHYLWSRTAASNATADANVNWAEGQAPSSVNDSARAMMASAAAFRDDIAGAIVTGGTSTAYTVTSYQIFDTLAHMSGQMIAFTPHTTNGATVTLNVDGLGAKPLRPSPSVELFAGTLIQGTPYIATYNNSDAVWYLHGFYSNPYNVPLGGGLDYWGTTVPNSSFAFANGTSISQTTYATLYTLFGSNKYGTDGGGLFALPDVRSRVTVKRDDMGGGATNRTTTAGGGLDSITLGSVGGSQSNTIITANLPAYTPTGTVATTTVSTIAASQQPQFPDQGGGKVAMGGGAAGGSFQATSFNSTSTFTGVAQGGSSTAMSNVQPAITCNYIIRVL